MDYTLNTYSRYVSPPYGGGVVVDFNPRNFKALSGKLFFVTGKSGSRHSMSALKAA